MKDWPDANAGSHSCLQEASAGSLYRLPPHLRWFSCLDRLREESPMSLIEQAAKRLEELRRAGAATADDAPALASARPQPEHVPTPEAVVRGLEARAAAAAARPAVVPTAAASPVVAPTAAVPPPAVPPVARVGSSSTRLPREGTAASGQR